MPYIYTPSGRAREYSPYALNVYLSCTHGCKYCYAPNYRRQSASQYFSKPYPRKNIAEGLRKELDKHTPRRQVLMSFVGDVYCETRDNNEATRACLSELVDHEVPTAILTKGGERCLRDMDLFIAHRNRIAIGTTLTFNNPYDSRQWEPGAALPAERVSVLKTLHDAGVRTFASFEPVIDPEQSLNLMAVTASMGIIDTYKIGKINNYEGIDRTINWTDFLGRALDILRQYEVGIYVKQDLRMQAPTIRLSKAECDPDLHAL